MSFFEEVGFSVKGVNYLSVGRRFDAHSSMQLHVELRAIVRIQTMPNLTKTQLNQHVENSASTSSQQDHADALGVQSRGGDRGNQYQSGNPSNEGMAPSQEALTAPEKHCKSR